MARGKRDGLLIAGGGLAGCLAALALARLRPDVPLLLVSEEESFGCRGGWLFFEADIERPDRWLIERTVTQSWPGYFVAFPGNSHKLKAPLHRIDAAALDRQVRDTLRPDQYRLGARIVAVREDRLLLQGGEEIRADGAIDARGGANLSSLEVGWRTAAICDYRLGGAHKLDRPVLIDATVEQRDQLRFMTLLPLGPDRLVVKDVRLTTEAEPDHAAGSSGIEDYLLGLGWRPDHVLEESASTAPLPLGGDFAAFWRSGGARVAKIGVRGGFLHPNSGQEVADAVATALLVAAQRDFSGPALHDALEQEAAWLWKKREWHRELNRVLLKADEGAARSMLERLYALDPPILQRLLGARTNLLDRRKIAAAAKG